MTNFEPHEDRYPEAEEPTVELKPVEVAGAEVDRVAGDEEESDYDSSPSIYIRAEFLGGNPSLTRVRDISVSIPIRPEDSFVDYAIAIETTIREISRLGYAPGYETPQIEVTKGTTPSWEQPHG